MSNLTPTRTTLLMCVVPAVIALISVYWIRKKKKFKDDKHLVTKPNTSESEKIDSLADSILDSADTLSDASSFASPESSEKSLRTKNFFESSTNNVKSDTFCNSNILDATPSSLFTASPMQCTTDVQTHNGPTPACSVKDKAIVEDVLCGGDSVEKCNLLSFNMEGLGSVGKIDINHSLTNNVDAEESLDMFSRLLNTQNSTSGTLNPMEELEKILGFNPSSLHVVENGVSHTDESIDDSTLPSMVNESAKLLSVETDSNDSHSSVLDENSLSYVSDDSDRHAAEVKNNKGSDFDESLCDDLDKSCSPVESKPCPVFNSKDSKLEEEVSKVQVTANFTPVIETSFSNQNPFTQSPDKIVLNGSFQLPETYSSCSSVDSPSEPKVASPSQIEDFHEAPTFCDSSASPAKSSLDANATPSPEEATKLMNGDGAGPHLESNSNVEGPQIAEMDINEHLKSIQSSTGLDNENCSESSSWEMQDSQSDAYSQSKMDEISLTGSKVPDNSNLYVHEFELPQEFCGRLIGKHGKHVKSIKDRSHANVYIKRHPYDPQLKIVVVEGSRSDVNDALDIIRRKYPPSRYPMVTLVKTNLSSNNVLPESLQLHIPDGASCDVILSSLVSAGHFFLQQPTHPTYPSLSTLDQCMIQCYAQMDTPLLPHPVEAGVICAAPIMNGWYRAQVIYVYENDIECELKFVDYGGFSQASTSSLRQIRSDFMSLPFQASECYLANVRPLDPTEGWSAEATATFEELAQGQILQALIVDYAADGIPCVHLYRVQGISNMFINKELVERGLAVWVNNNHWDPH